MDDKHATLERLERAGFPEDVFNRLHHFVSDKFKTEPQGFAWLNRIWARQPNGFRPEGENERFIARLELAWERRQAGATWEEAIATAWDTYPIVTR